MAQTLDRTLGLKDLTLLVVGCVIGSGIFLVPGVVLRQSGGDVGIALLVWLIAGLLSLLGALTYGELGAMNPQAGGLYIYVRDAFGRLPAFLYGWTLFFVLSSGAVATLAVAFAAYFGQLVPVGPVAARLVSLLMIAVVAVINVRGTRQSAGVQNWTTAFKITAVLAMGVALIALGGSLTRGQPFWPDRFDASTLSAMGVAMIGVLWAYEGWQNVTFSAGETKNAQSVFPRGLVLGTAALIGTWVIGLEGLSAGEPIAQSPGPRRFTRGDRREEHPALVTRGLSATGKRRARRHAGALRAGSGVLGVLRFAGSSGSSGSGLARIARSRVRFSDSRTRRTREPENPRTPEPPEPAFVRPPS